MKLFIYNVMVHRVPLENCPVAVIADPELILVRQKDAKRRLTSAMAVH